MTTFTVTREAGPAWTDGNGIFEQPGADEHGACMGGLAAEGLILLAGPVAGTEVGRLRVLLIAEAESEADVRRRLADDPWEASGQLVTTVVEPWNLLVGGERVAPRQ
jgi:uncharacterized protein YciI